MFLCHRTKRRTKGTNTQPHAELTSKSRHLQCISPQPYNWPSKGQKQPPDERVDIVAVRRSRPSRVRSVLSGTSRSMCYIDLVMEPIDLLIRRSKPRNGA